MSRQTPGERWMSFRKPYGMLIGLALVVAGCGSVVDVPYPTVSGRRVQGTSLTAHTAVPYRVGAYELTFANVPGENAHARRAALLVDMAAGQGHVRGFVEWGKAGEVPSTYVVGGWARQRNGDGGPVTVFDLALSHFDGSARNTPASERWKPLALRVVVDEASGDVTLTRRQ